MFSPSHLGSCHIAEGEALESSHDSSLKVGKLRLSAYMSLLLTSGLRAPKPLPLPSSHGSNDFRLS